MTTDLSAWYIAAVTRALPAKLQSDVSEELAASIADAVESRIAQGEEAKDAERAVLSELGDPEALAADYLDRPLHLIGPRYYLAWWRLLKLLLWIVPLCVFGGVALGQSLAGAAVGEIIGSAFVAVLGATVHVAFWTTLVFAVLERTGADATNDWELDSLSEPAPQGAGRADMIASLVFLGLVFAALVWDVTRGFAVRDGEWVSALHPQLWPWAILGFAALLLAQAALAILVHATGRWTTAIALGHTIVAVVFATLSLSLLLRDKLFNPAFLEVVFTRNGVGDEVLHILAVLLAFGIVTFSLWAVIDGWLKKVRADRLGRAAAIG